MLYVIMARPWAVAPSNCPSSLASSGIHTVGVRVTSCPWSGRALCKALLDVSASRCRCNFLLTLWLQRGFGLNESVYFGAMGFVKIQYFLHLCFSQVIVFSDFGRSHILRGDDNRLHPNSGTPQNRR